MERECNDIEKSFIDEHLILAETAGRIAGHGKRFGCKTKSVSGFAFFTAVDAEELSLHKEQVLRRKELSW